MKTLTITEDKVKEAASKCPDVKRTMEILFPEVFQKPSNEVNVGTATYGVGSFLCERQYGNLAHKSFYLDSSYDWKLVVDSEAHLVLQPTLKTKTK